MHTHGGGRELRQGAAVLPQQEALCRQTGGGRPSSPSLVQVLLRLSNNTWLLLLSSTVVLGKHSDGRPGRRVNVPL